MAEHRVHLGRFTHGLEHGLLLLDQVIDQPLTRRARQRLAQLLDRRQVLFERRVEYRRQRLRIGIPVVQTCPQVLEAVHLDE